MRKKIIFTVVLGALLSINVCMAKNFSDLASSHWGYQAITKMSETGIVSGYPDGTFRPDNSITRAEFSSILVRALGLTKMVNYEYGGNELGYYRGKRDTRNAYLKYGNEYYV